MVRRKSRGAKEPTAEEVAHAAGVRVEQTQTDFRILLDGFRSLDESVKREVGSLREEIGTLRGEMGLFAGHWIQVFLTPDGEVSDVTLVG
jgi:hypothetical protein